MSAVAHIAAPTIDSLELYAAGIDTSDYVGRIAPLIAARVQAVGDLLDLGAGGGQLGAAVRDPAGQWIAVEPAAVMQARLKAAVPPPDRLLCQGWQSVALPPGACDTVLAANIAAPLENPAFFLERCRRWARRAVVWVVPAQRGPRGLCLAGLLPRDWHGEDETPGVDLVCAGLSADQPHSIDFADWTFSAVVPRLDELARHLAERLGWKLTDERRESLYTHLKRLATPTAAGYRLDVHRKSAVLYWRRK